MGVGPGFDIEYGHKCYNIVQHFGHTQYVKITLESEGNRHLCLSEVQVFVNGENKALQGTATQSSDYKSVHQASKAIDDITNGGNQDISCTKLERNPWWELKLRTDYDIDYIVIWQRNGVSGSLDGAKVEFKENDNRFLRGEPYIIHANDSTRSFSFYKPLGRAQYVRVLRVKVVSPWRVVRKVQSLTVGEVQVFGYKQNKWSDKKTSVGSRPPSSSKLDEYKVGFAHVSSWVGDLGYFWKIQRGRERHWIEKIVFKVPSNQAESLSGATVTLLDQHHKYLRGVTIGDVAGKTEVEVRFEKLE